MPWLLALGCGPAVELETDTTTLDDDSTTTVADDSTTTTPTPTTADETSTGVDDDPTIDPMPDMGDPLPSLCPAGSGDLVLEWGVTDAAERADAVAVGVGRVAWMAGEFGDSHLRVLDLDGNPLWDDPVPMFGGEGDLSLEDLAIDPSGGVILAGAMTGDSGWFAGLFRWYDADGNVLAEDVHENASHTIWQGVALLPDGDAVVAGESEEVMLVRRYTPDAMEAWTQMAGQNGSLWGSHVAVAPAGTIFVSAHTNTIPGPVVRAYDGDGMLQWSYEDEVGGWIDTSFSVASDSQGRAVLPVTSEMEDHRVHRFDAAGSIELTIPLDFGANAVAVDADDSIVVAGAINGQSTVVVERYAADGTHLARYEREGRFATGVAVDEDCHAYVVGYTNFVGAWLDRLR
ncbi:NHL repeat-containing protein [Paraliomyxa miuraensis]|uniref:hypothetical protein n=1 Tax=Paraliomyxa miuraensis TaxID=376150 RepID=UPI00225B1E29|nr:hypothetical protein [Paraliomyxa miuraensis]MCX4244179.1 hypothetical protein [Paraliomyxa miuraensis]